MKLLPVGFLPVILLSACGGGSDDSGSTPTPNGPTETFTYTAVNVNTCGIETPQTDAVLLVHNDDFSTRQVIEANSNGELRVTVEQGQNVTLSFFTASYSSNNVGQVNINTYIDAAPASIRQTFSSFTPGNDGCECTDVTVNISNAILPERHDSVILNQALLDTNWSDETLSGQYTTSVCRAPGESWPALSASTYFGAPDEYYTGILSDYSVNELIGFPVENLAERVDIIPGPLSYPGINQVISTSAAIVDNNAIFSEYRNIADAGTANFFTDEEIDVHAFASIVDAGDIAVADPDIGSMRVRSYSRRYVTDLPSQPIDFNHIDYSIVDAELDRSAELDTFDFSAAGADLVVVSTSLTDINGSTVLTWSIVTPAQGDFTALDEIELEDANHPLLNNQSIELSDEVYMDFLIYRFDELNSYSRALEATEIGAYSGRHELISGYDYISASFVIR